MPGYEGAQDDFASLLWRPHKRQGGHVVWNQGFAGELADGGQD
jgi:hypothetical protein